MARKISKIRYIEAITGIILILAVSAMLLAMLTDFSFVTPFSSLQEDMTYLSDNISSLRISALIRLSCGVLSLLLLPFFLITFSHHTRIYHYFSSFLILGIAAYYLLSVRFDFRMISIIQNLPADFHAGEASGYETQFLLTLRYQKNLIMIGRMLIGLFLIFFAFSKIKARRVPVVSALLFLLSGPLIIYYSWKDPEHILLTAAMAAGATGMLILGLRLINKGLKWLPERRKKKESKPEN